MLSFKTWKLVRVASVLTFLAAITKYMTEAAQGRKESYSSSQFDDAVYLGREGLAMRVSLALDHDAGHMESSQKAGNVGAQPFLHFVQSWVPAHIGLPT